MIYIHVPFCRSRCLYCDFFSSTKLELRESYLNALLREMDARRDEIILARAQTLYIGGGTPSQLGTDALKKIFDHISGIVPIEDCAEVTIEINPDDVTVNYANALRKLPINRISMGIQSLDDNILHLIGRRHSAQQAHMAVNILRDTGFENISLDLMYGLPEQTFDGWKSDIDRILELHIPHLSAYSLQWEEGTRLYTMLQKGEVHEADEELSLKMYEYLMDVTARYGMHHYEISNFALPGWEARHNSGYWRDDAYVGLGPGAHSYDGKRKRSWNVSDIREYVSDTYIHENGERSEILSDADIYNEKVMKRLRTDDGLALSELNDEQCRHALYTADAHIKAGRMVLKNGHLKLTRKGIFVSNDIMSDLML